jgi:tricorn protease
LINASSGSDAEIFPAGWRKLGLGPVIGIDTAGAVIGTNGFTLVDGTSVRLPLVGWYELDERNLELSGTKPDIWQDVNPDELAAGRDAQLELAVETLLGKL